MMVVACLIKIIRWCRRSLVRLIDAPRRKRALRELERLDRATLDDIGLNRSELVGRCFGRRNGRCARF